MQQEIVDRTHENLEGHGERNEEHADRHSKKLRASARGSCRDGRWNFEADVYPDKSRIAKRITLRIELSTKSRISRVI